MPCTLTGTCWLCLPAGDTLGISCSSSNERAIEIWGDTGAQGPRKVWEEGLCAYSLTGHSMVCGLPRPTRDPLTHAVVPEERDPSLPAFPGTPLWCQPVTWAVPPGRQPFLL